MNGKVALESLLIALAFVCAMRAEASVVIAGTRVIYNQKDPEVTIKLSNVGSTPSLVQAWVDNGDPKVSPTSLDVPFIVTPPASRIDPQKGQTLRIVYTGDALPPDRESVFWLNVLEIPPKPTSDNAAANTLQLAFRVRIKLFYRPVGLKGNSVDAPAQVTWHLTTRNRQSVLEVTNHGVYDVSFTDLKVGEGNGAATFDDGDMVAPGETRTIPLHGAASGSPTTKVHYHALDDYGGAVEGEASLQ